jgi:hypothetical protein
MGKYLQVMAACVDVCTAAEALLPSTDVAAGELDLMDEDPREAAEEIPLALDQIVELRRLTPGLLRSVKTKDGRRGVLWGVHARGVIVSFGSGRPLLTLEPTSISMICGENDCFDQDDNRRERQNEI